MAIIYAMLIINGKKEFKDVPERVKEQVRKILEELDVEYLAVDPE